MTDFSILRLLICMNFTTFACMRLTKTSISILLPSYNNDVRALANNLCVQAEDIKNQVPLFAYEIIIADDGSTDKDVVDANRSISNMPNCRFIEMGENIGRSRIRNRLAQEARYDYLLFIDSDMMPFGSTFLMSYVTSDGNDVIDGGVIVPEYLNRVIKGNLRHMYEKAAQPMHTAEKRSEAPYRDFHTANFMIRREVMMSIPFDERFRSYGYEDVLLGKRMKQAGMEIRHIDNPVAFMHFESNDSFLKKSECAMRTLYQFRSDLRGYSNVITATEVIQRIVPSWVSRMLFWMAAPMLRANIRSSHPSLKIFSMYKLGYYITLCHNGKGQADPK